MEEEEKSSLSIYIKIAIVAFVLILAYIFFPKKYWNEVGNNYKPRSNVEKDTGPTPTALKFRNPFKYDDYTPVEKSNFLKRQSEHKEGSDKESLFWKK